jgi:hypothetical protein
MFVENDQRQQKLRTLLEGIVDGIVEQPETDAIFKEWRRASGLRAAAYLVVRRDRTLKKLREQKATAADLRAALSARNQAKLSFYELCSVVSETAGMREDFHEFINRFGISGPIVGPLADTLIDRFCRKATNEGGWPFPLLDPNRVPRLLVTDRPFTFTIPSGTPVAFAEAMLIGTHPDIAEDPGQSLRAWKAMVQAHLKSLEAGAKKDPGLPFEEYAKSTRRDGRWFFLVETGRATMRAIAAEYHQNLPKHAIARGQSSAPTCDNCVRTVQEQLTSARKFLESELNPHQ